MSWFHHWFFPRESNNQRARLLHPSSLFLLVALVFGFQILVSKIAGSYPFILGYASANIRPEDIIRLTNNQRQAKGLPLLTLDSQLTAAAAQKAADMFARDYWAHVSPTGLQPWSFITGSGYSYRYAGENLARDFSDAPSILTAWMASPTHRDNILNSRYQDIGVAVVDGQLGGVETTLVVQMFGSRLSAAASTGQTSAFAVQAAATNISPPLASPFAATKYFSLGILLVLALVLLVDIVWVWRAKLVRWTSKSLAHFIFITILIIGITSLLRGQII